MNLSRITNNYNYNNNVGPNSTKKVMFVFLPEMKEL